MLVVGFSEPRPSGTLPRNGRGGGGACQLFFGFPFFFWNVSRDLCLRRLYLRRRQISNPNSKLPYTVFGRELPVGCARWELEPEVSPRSRNVQLERGTKHIPPCLFPIGLEIHHSA
jgi:hypothetical protein